MKKQNTAMHATSAIPIFGLYPAAAEFQVSTASGQLESVSKWIYHHPDIIKIEKTASSKDLGKFMLLVERENKDEVDDFLDNLFDQLPDAFQAGQIKKPQRVGNSFQKRRVNNINNYLNKLKERVQADLLMYDEDTISTTPPTRPRRMTISYAQAAKRLSFHSTIQKSTNKTGNTPETTTTSMSTLTQSSLEEAMAQIRAETEKSINELRQEFTKEVQSMDQKIAAAVIAAIRSSPPMDPMETEYAETNSTQSSQHTAATIQTLADKYDSLHNAMLMLTKTVTELAEKQDQTQYKRNRPLDTPPKLRFPPTIDSPKMAATAQSSDKGTTRRGSRSLNNPAS
jgi:hypothetical protein